MPNYNNVYMLTGLTYFINHAVFTYPNLPKIV